MNDKWKEYLEARTTLSFKEWLKHQQRLNDFFDRKKKRRNK